MKKPQRIISLLMTINTRQKFTLKQLADELGVSRRTILRDLQELSQMGVPLYSELGMYGGYQMLRERKLPPVSFSEHEAFALFFISLSLKSYQSLPFGSDAPFAFKKFYHILPEDRKEQIDELQKRLHFWVAPRQYETPYLQTLLQASIKRSVLKVTYESLRGVSELSLQPYGIYTLNGSWFCIGMNYDTERVYTFLVERFRLVEDTALPLKKHKALDTMSIEEMINWSDNEPLVDAIVQLTKRGVLQCRSDVWRPGEIVENMDGTGVLRFKMLPALVNKYAGYFLSLGREAVVKEPLILKESIQKSLKDMVDQYSD